MSKPSQEHHEQILQEWRTLAHSKPNRSFISDGPLDWRRWSSNNEGRPRVLFLLKEAYSESSDACDWGLPEQAREWIETSSIAARKTWRVMALWAKALREFDVAAPPPMSSFPTAAEDRAHIHEHLLHTAVINLKKYDGGKKSSDADLVDHLISSPSGNAGHSNHDLLRRQLNALAPDIVVCGGTFSSFRVAFTGDGSTRFRPVGDPDWDCHQADGALWLDYWHPDHRGAADFLLIQGLHAMQLYAAHEGVCPSRLT